MKKSAVGILLATLSIILGIFAVLQAALKNLPVTFPVPTFLPTFFLLFGIVIAGLGWNDELETGFKGLIGLVQNFFANPFRKLLLTGILALAQKASSIVGLPEGYVLAAQIILAIATVFSFGAAVVQYHVALMVVKMRKEFKR